MNKIFWFLIIIINLNCCPALAFQDRFYEGIEAIATNEIIVSYKTESAMNADRIKMKSNAKKLAIPGRVLTLKYNSSTEAENQLELFNQRRDVEFAGINYVYYEQIVPNDPRVGSQYYINLLRFPQAWDLIKGTESFIVAAPDSGFDKSRQHEDLSLKLPGYNFVNNNSDFVTDITYPSDHGINVSGMISALADNSKGIASGSWRSKLIPIRISKPFTPQANTNYITDTSTMIKALEFAVANGAKVVSFSFNLVGNDAIYLVAKKYHDQGIIVLFAGGNNRTNLKYGISNKYLIFVGASTETDTRASFSNFGMGIDIFAPGQSCLTTISNNGYGSFSGTSCAAPLAASLCVLLKSANSNLNTVQIKRILKNTAIDLGTVGWDAQFSWGRIDAYDAVRAALGQISITDNKNPIVNIAPTNDSSIWFYRGLDGKVREVYPIVVNAEDNFEVDKIELFCDNIKVDEKTDIEYSQQIFNFRSRAFSNGSHVLKAKATDVTGLSTEVTLNIVIDNSATDTTPPSVNIIAPLNNSVLVGQFSINIDASDNNSVSRVEVYINNQLVQTLTSSPYSVSLNTSNYSTGTKTLKAIAYDPSGNRAESIRTVKFSTEFDTTPPTIFITSPETLTIARSGTSIKFTFVTRDDGGIAKINLYRSNTLIKSTITPPFTIFDDLTLLPEGNYTYYAEAIDTSGNIGRSLPIVIRKR